MLSQSISPKVQRPRTSTPNIPRDHQLEAIVNASRALEHGGRAQVVMACGTGKTLVGVETHRTLQSKRTATFNPSLALVTQNLKDWRRDAPDFDGLVVCSDESITSVDRLVIDKYEIPAPVTTDPREIQKFLASKGDKPKVIFSTYQSSPVVALGMNGSAPIHLAILDEVHRTTGLLTDERAFNTPLRDELIPAHSRLCMTATSKIIRPRGKMHEDFEISSMDNPALYGNVVYRLSFGDAILRGLLTDYQVVVPVVTSGEAEKWRDTLGRSEPLAHIGAAIALVKAIQEHSLKRVVTFHNRISSAHHFANDLIPLILKSMGGDHPKILSRHIQGDMPSSVRNEILRRFSLPVNINTKVLSNCRCLQEGVDIPGIDGIAFIDPKSGWVDIIQAIGRAMRLSPNKQLGTIIVPLILEEGEDAETVIESDRFRVVWDVVRALRMHDGRIETELSAGDRCHFQILVPEREDIFESGAGVKSLEREIVDQFLDKITTKVALAAQITHLSEEKIIAWAESYRSEHGHYPDKSSGPIPDTAEDWKRLDLCLKMGSRGLQQRSGIHGLLEHYKLIPKFDRGLIRTLVDNHLKQTGKLPTASNDTIEGYPWITWRKLHDIFERGEERIPRTKGGLKGFLIEENLITDFDPKLIATWMKNFRAVHGQWPIQSSGTVKESPTDDWKSIHQAILNGDRGISAHGSITAFLEKQGLIPAPTDTNIIEWMKRYFAQNEKWPELALTKTEPQYGRTWRKIAFILAHKEPVDISLRTEKEVNKLRWVNDPEKWRTEREALIALLKFREKHGLFQSLREEDVAYDLKEYFEQTRRFPKEASSVLYPQSGCTWGAVHLASVHGLFGLPPTGGIYKILDKYGIVVPYDIEEVKSTIARYVESHGKFPTERSESNSRGIKINFKWRQFEEDLRRGTRGLEKCNCIADFIFREGLSNPLTVEEIIGFVELYRRGKYHYEPYPNSESPLSAEYQLSWSNLDRYLMEGLYGFPNTGGLEEFIKLHCPRPKTEEKSSNYDYSYDDDDDYY